MINFVEQVLLTRHHTWTIAPVNVNRSFLSCQVETSAGEWIPAEPISDTILVNIGDVMEVVTAGRLRATNHRVLLPSSEQARRTSRQTMAFFVQPDEGTTVSPPDGDVRYQPMDFSKFIEEKFASVYPTYHLSD